MSIYRKDSWEVDWQKRKPHGYVWARNVNSKMPAAREWHWTYSHVLKQGGIPWKRRFNKGHSVTTSGYIVLYKSGLSVEQLAAAEANNLFHKGKCLKVPEHRLVAAMKYGRLPSGSVVRHLNGIRTDNRPENLVLGSQRENALDHSTARLEAMVWREKYEQLLASIQKSA